MSDHVIRPLRSEEIQIAVDWAADEGWNPGRHDAQCFHRVDTQGFWGVFLDGRMIASVSVVKYDETFAFLGFYIVHPDYRGLGFGLRLWEHAIAQCESDNIGLDGVVDQQENYRKSGFTLAYRNIRHGGSINGALAALKAPAKGREPAAAEQPYRITEASPRISAFDSAHFPVPRESFIQGWLSAPKHVSYATEQDGEITGYGTLRPCRNGYKIGPLFAADPVTARALLISLLSEIPASDHETDVYLDTPEPNTHAVSLAQELGLVPVFETARMYTGRAPDLDLARIFGVTTFELG